MSIDYKISLPTADWNIRGKQLAIVGYSHHLDDDYRSEFTQELLVDVSENRRHIAFFTRISSYFGLSNQEFWPHVIYFNFLPGRIGDKDDKYKTAPADVHEAARRRVLSILSDNEIERILVFSTKAWNNFPDTDGEKSGEKCSPLFERTTESRYRVEIGTYTINGRPVLAAGFRHPERANAEEMRHAVETFMSLK